MLFYLYNLNIWRGRYSDLNTNKFRLKSAVLQLLDGFSKVNMLEKVERSLKEHYVISDTNFNEIKSFERNLIKFEESIEDLNYTQDVFYKILSNFVNHYDLTKV